VVNKLADDHELVCEEVPTVSQSIVANVVTWVVRKVEEQSGDRSSAVLNAGNLCFSQLRKGSSHGYKDQAHATSRKHKHPSSGEVGHNQSNDCSVHETPAVVGEIDACFGKVAGISHHVEEKVGVEAQESVSGELGEETEEDGNQESASHTRCSDHVEPVLFFDFGLELDGRLDLCHFGPDEQGVYVAFSVVFDENSERFFVTTVRDQPTGAFWQEAAQVSL